MPLLWVECLVRSLFSEKFVLMSTIVWYHVATWLFCLFSSFAEQCRWRKFESSVEAFTAICAGGYHIFVFIRIPSRVCSVVSNFDCSFCFSLYNLNMYLRYNDILCNILTTQGSQRTPREPLFRFGFQWRYSRWRWDSVIYSVFLLHFFFCADFPSVG